jgi:DNA polymerase III alpha subunit
VKIEDGISSIEILVFPSLLKETPEIWVDGKVVIIRGKVSDKDQDIKLLGNTAKEITQENKAAVIKEFRGSGINRSYINSKNGGQKAPKPLKLIFKKDLPAEKMDDLKKLFGSNSGYSKVYFKINGNGKSNIIETGFRVKNSATLTSELKDHFNEYIQVV